MREWRPKKVEQLDRVIIRFAGDSGDGMQLTGDRFTSETATLGNDLATFPDFPAEIRAPAGSLPGVSGFQVHFADHDILTAGDRPDVLVAMNPAALKTNIGDLPKGGTIIVNTDAFNDRTLQKAGYAANPLEDGSLADYHVHEVALTSMTVGALKGIEGITLARGGALEELLRARAHVLALPPPDRGDARLHRRRSSPSGPRSSRRTRRRSAPAGTTARRRRTSPSRTRSRRPSSRPGTYRQITGNTALSYGLIAASKLSGLPLFLGAYPITPASSILEELAGKKEFGVVTFQAEDEIAAVGAALGAAFGGALGVTASAGPGLVLKAETVGLAIALELPLLILDIQRAGPSTGHADEARAGRPADGALRPQRREPGARRRRLEPVAVLPRRDRGGRASRSSTARRSTSSRTRTSRTAPSRG